ncbi:hypothetical protein D917_03689, partial [Trichinella nativa]
MSYENYNVETHIPKFSPNHWPAHRCVAALSLHLMGYTSEQVKSLSSRQFQSQ